MGPFKSFWDLTEVSEQSWYKVLTYEIVNPTFKISLLVRIWIPAVNARRIEESHLVAHEQLDV